MHDMAHHVSSFHLDLGQLWMCPVSWCTQWKSTPQDCIDHIRKKHNVGDSVKTASLGKWFPPWTVTRAEWHTALKPKVSGIYTDTALFSEHGAQLVHHYRVSRDCAAHASLRGSYMIDFSPTGPAPMYIGRPNIAGIRDRVPFVARTTDSAASKC